MTRTHSSSRGLLLAALILFTALTLAPDIADAQRRGGGGRGGGFRGGGGGARMSRPAARPSAPTRTSVNRDFNRNVNRDVNRNVNRDIDRDIDRDVDIDVDDHWHPVARAAAVTTAAVATAAAVGSVVYTLPAGCVTTVVNGIAYRQCGGAWYEPVMDGDTVTYVVVNAP